jgi:hypothetical protein
MRASSKDARDCAGNCFAYDNDKPRPAVHKEELGHALSLNMPARLGLRRGLAFLPGRFF